MSVQKRDITASTNDLKIALNEFCKLLIDQKENEAVEDLKKASEMLDITDKVKEATSLIIDCFEGDHELVAYTLHKQSESWSVADQLSFYSTRVLTLSKRMNK